MGGGGEGEGKSCITKFMYMRRLLCISSYDVTEELIQY